MGRTSIGWIVGIPGGFAPHPSSPFQGEDAIAATVRHILRRLRCWIGQAHGTPPLARGRMGGGRADA